jgi:hypothetical protein
MALPEPLKAVADRARRDGRSRGKWLGGDDRFQPPGVGRAEPRPHGAPRGGNEERGLGAELFGQGERGAFQPFGALGLPPP